MPARVRVASFALIALALALLSSRADAQVRERPVAFDSAGRVTTITPPLAARLGLAAPTWPVSGDYLDARLYSVDDEATAFVLVVRRQRDVLERFALDLTHRRAIAAAIAGSLALSTASVTDSLPTFISEPVRGSFVVNQALLGAFVFGPAAAAISNDPTAASAAYLAVAGGTFFAAANITTTRPVSRAQNHLAWHSARRGSIAASLLLYSATGDDSGREYGAAILGGGIAGDVLGFVLGEPMTDAEAHGTSHGSTITGVLAGGVLGASGMFENNFSGRLGTALIVGAGAMGYPLGLRYVRTAPYRVTAGDVGTLVTTEFIGMAAAATLLPDAASPAVGYGLLTAGFAAGALAGDRLLVRPFDHTESEARLVQYGAGAGAVVAMIVPVLAQSDNSHLIFGALTIGGLVGAIATESLIAPQRAGNDFGGIRTSSSPAGSSRGVDIRFAPESVLLAGAGVRGRHSILSVTF